MGESKEIFMVKRTAQVRGISSNYPLLYSKTLGLSDRQKLQWFYSSALFKPKDDH